MNLLNTSTTTNFNLTDINEDQNLTNVNLCAIEPPEEWVYTVVQVYILLISVLGIIFNVFVLMVFCLHKKPCTVAEIYLSNLAAADLILVSFLPFWAVNVSNRFNWTFGSVLCQLVNLSIIMNLYCSIYFLVVVSINRYVALVHPLIHNSKCTPKYAKLACLLVWGLGFLMSVPTMVYRKLGHHYNSTICYLDYQDHTVMMVFEGINMVMFTIPIPIIIYCNLRIIHSVNRRVKVGLKTRRMEQRATTLILAVFVAFLICWVPFQLVRIIELLLRANVLTGCSLQAVLGICKQIFTYLAFFNSILNPILYVVVGKTFREKVKEVFKQFSSDSLQTTEAVNDQ